MNDRRAPIRLFAEYRSGFTDYILKWKVEADDGKGLLKATWSDWRNKPSSQELECPLNLSHVPLDTAWDWLLPLEPDYAILATDLSLCRIVLTDDANQLQRGIYGYGSELLGQHPEILAFYLIWDAIEITVERCLPSELGHRPRPWN
jgi:hypothetical protein